MSIFLIFVLLFTGTCLGDTSNKASDEPVINGVTVTDAPVTEVDPPTDKSPTTTPSSATTTTIPTTSKPNTTTAATTTKPTTASTTSKQTTTSTTKATTTTPNSTLAPITTTTSPHHDRKFDGPSFVGGIILALGLVAIGFVAFKFYKARTELNYHTL